MDIAFRRITRDDFPMIGRWLRDPQVAWWWNDDADPEALEAQYGPSIDGSDPTEVFITRIDGAEVGLIQRYRLHDEEEYIAELAPYLAIPDSAMSIDDLLADAVAGKVAAPTWSARSSRGSGTTTRPARASSSPSTPTTAAHGGPSNATASAASPRGISRRTTRGALTPARDLPHRPHRLSLRAAGSQLPKPRVHSVYPPCV